MGQLLIDHQLPPQSISRGFNGEGLLRAELSLLIHNDVSGDRVGLLVIILRRLTPVGQRGNGGKAQHLQDNLTGTPNVDHIHLNNVTLNLPGYCGITEDLARRRWRAHI